MNKTIDKETKAALEKMISDGVVSRESAAKYFPELKESEGEKIKNQILYAIRQLPICKETKDKCVAWVEDKSVEWDKSDIATLGEIIMTLHTGVFMSSPDRKRQVEWLKRLTPQSKKELKKIEQNPVIEMKTPEESLGVNSDTYNKIVDECVYGEQKPAWSEDDEVGLGDAMWAIKQAKTIAKDENDMGNLWYAERWLKSIKGRVQPKPMKGLSEEDESIVTELIGIFESAVDGWHVSFPYRLIRDYKRVLKSCLYQNTWKPSEEQMEALDNFIYAKYPNVEKHEAAVKSLYQDLKKLSGE